MDLQRNRSQRRGTQGGYIHEMVCGTKLQRQSVTMAVMDISAGYVSVSRAVCPNAEPVCDGFHYRHTPSMGLALCTVRSMVG